MKAIIVFCLGAVSTASLLWLGIVNPGRRATVVLESRMDAAMRECGGLRTTLAGWQGAGQRHFPEITSADALSERIGNVLRERDKALASLELQEIKLSKMEAERLRAMLASDKLEPALLNVEMGIAELKSLLPSQEHVRSTEPAR